MSLYNFSAPTTVCIYAPGATGFPGAAVLPTSEQSAASWPTGSAYTSISFNVPNAGNVILHVVQGGTTASTIYFWPMGASLLGYSLQATNEWAQALGTVTGSDWLFGPFSPKVFNDSNGLLNASLSSVTNISVGVYLLPGAAS